MCSPALQYLELTDAGSPAPWIDTSFAVIDCDTVCSREFQPAVVRVHTSGPPQAGLEGAWCVVFFLGLSLSCARVLVLFRSLARGLQAFAPYHRVNLNRRHSKSRSPIKPDPARLSQTTTQAAPTPWTSFLHQSSPAGTPHDIAPPVAQFPPAPAPVSAPPSIKFVNSDNFARARIAAVQSWVGTPFVYGPRASPPTRDKHYWCGSVPGLMRHITYQHAGSTVDEPTCALFVAQRPPGAGACFRATDVHWLRRRNRR